MEVNGNVNVDQLIENRQKLRDRKTRLDILFEGLLKRHSEVLEGMKQKETSPEMIDRDIETAAVEEVRYQQEKVAEISQWEKDIEQVEKLFQG